MDLFKLLESRHFAPLPEKDVRKIIHQIGRTIQACHNQGVAHHDIKLENVSPRIDFEFSLNFL
jgi:serine/threonine protein kinase